jgi:hypothetical protein
MEQTIDKFNPSIIFLLWITLVDAPRLGDYIYAVILL